MPDLKDERTRRHRTVSYAETGGSNYRLTTGWGTTEPPLSLVFGHVLETVLPVVKHFLGDFYHDVMWMSSNLKGPATFYFGARESGTNIGFKLSDIGDSNRVVLKVVIEYEERNDSWYLKIHRLRRV
jgi:hypothetical protein